MYLKYEKIPIEKFWDAIYNKLYIRLIIYLFWFFNSINSFTVDLSQNFNSYKDSFRA